jgi:hypothetical protein
MLRIVCIFGLLFFSYAAAMQYNDPDPLVWMPFYAIVAVANFAALLGRWPSRYIALAAIPHVLYGLWLSPNLLSTSAESFATIGMKNDQDELVREAWGAVICALWMAGLYIHARYRASRQHKEVHA